MLLDDLETDPPLCVGRLTQLHERSQRDLRHAHVLAEAIASGSPALERAGGWLLRKHVQAGGAISADDWSLVIDALGGLRSHLGRLLVYQLLNDRPELMEAAPDEIAQFLLAGLQDPRGSVRAWSLSAFELLARRHPQHRPRLRRAIAAAERDSEPCVRARLRRMSAARLRRRPRASKARSAPAAP